MARRLRFPMRVDDSPATLDEMGLTSAESEMVKWWKAEFPASVEGMSDDHLANLARLTTNRRLETEDALLETGMMPQEAREQANLQTQPFGDPNQ